MLWHSISEGNERTMQTTQTMIDRSAEIGEVPPVCLAVRNLRKSYGSGPDAKTVIDGLSFEIHTGEFVCIVGPSGVGKTTLLKCLSGLMPSSGGVIEIDGVPVSGPPRQMALVFQEYTRSLMAWLSVEGNVKLPLRHLKLSREEEARRCSEAISAVGLGESAHLYPWQLSGGMQQRVAIARALAYRPEILIMDEPFASVDAQTRFDLEDLCLQLRLDFGITILLVTHDIDEAVYLGDRVIVLGAKPARVLRVIDVDLPSSRDQIATRALPRFAELRTEVLSLIKRGGEAAL